MKITVITEKTRGLQNKRVLLRLDLNVPRRGSRILGDYKLRASLPTLRLLLAHGTAVIIVTHLGEPSGRRSDKKNFSTRPLSLWLEKKLRKKIVFLDGSWSDIKKNASGLKPGQLALLENIRLFPGETENSLVLAKRLAGLADIYVNDAFAVSHRNHASVSAIKKFLPSFAGPLLYQELVHLEKARVGKKPLVLIMGGAKISTKLPLLKTFGSRAYKVLMGGALATTILKARGRNVGQSVYDTEGLSVARKLSFSNIMLPKDAGVAIKKKRLDKDLNDIGESDVILDIGARTLKLYEPIIKKAKTVIWNGPVGVFEKKLFARGTQSLGAAVVANKRAYTVIGGGETAEALSNLSKRFSWVSTGGGATLAYLSGQLMPGLTKIVKK